MKALIEALRDDVDQRRAAAVATYRELLHRGGDNDCTPRDTAKFREAAELLGKDLGAVSTDYRIVGKAREWKAIAETAPEAQAAHVAATIAHQAHLDEMKRVRESMELRARILYGEQADAASRVRNAERALEELRGLKHSNPLILIGIDADLPEPAPLEQGGPFEVIGPAKASRTDNLSNFDELVPLVGCRMPRLLDGFGGSLTRWIP